MDPRDRIGTQFAGRYQILSLLGEGGMGAVFEARQSFTGRHVALKLVHSAIARSHTARERFLREAQAPSSIGHPAIVEVIDAGVEGDTPYIALELLAGEDLGSAISHGRISGQELVEASIEVLDALHAAHAAGLVHRDIKPENVFLARAADGARHVKLLDFGITRQLGVSDSKLTGTGTILGTPYYMSPEQARGEHVDGRADLWSVGAMLYHGLAGHPPFQAANYNLLIVAILTTDATPLTSVRPELSVALARVVDRALAKDLAARWQTAAEMRAALAEAAGTNIAIPATLGTAPTLPSDQGPLAAPPTQPGPFGASLPAASPHAIPIAPTLQSAEPIDRRDPKSRVGLVLAFAALGLLLLAGGTAIGWALLGPAAEPDVAAVEDHSAPAATVEPIEAPQIDEATTPPDPIAAGDGVPPPTDTMTTTGSMRLVLGGGDEPTIVIGDDGEVTIDGLTPEQIEAIATGGAERAAAAERRAKARIRRAREIASMREAVRQRCHLACITERHQCAREVSLGMHEGNASRAILDCHNAFTRCSDVCGAH